MRRKITDITIQKAADAFATEGSRSEYRKFGSGHINDTFLLTCDRRYILQRLNTEIFKDPIAVIRNIEGVTGFLRKKIVESGGDPDRETLNLVKTSSGEDYYIDEVGNFWRMYYFIEGASCFNTVEKAEDFRNSAMAFGHFQHMLADYPASTLVETIPGFHDTPKRFARFKEVVAKDALHKAESAKREIEFVLARGNDMALATDMQKSGELPLRVTHNDTKLNNIMIDDKTGEAICVIDLDTVMPGLSINDFGDSIRFGANTALEDERDLSKVSLSLPLYNTYVDGFLCGCAGSLTDKEIGMLPQGARLMTLECGMRFLTDYLEGDVYFHTEREGQNLDRTRTQFELVADMERKWDAMEQACAEYRK
ncbi:MAG: aminoglycoside phosphotransferase family protein [Clostridiales bacterium]|jgi:hypothetical protein|nr:aminoglycoside phosphotransferase family protein [Clostridiales bacterium]